MFAVTWTMRPATSLRVMTSSLTTTWIESTTLALAEAGGRKPELAAGVAAAGVVAAGVPAAGAAAWARAWPALIAHSSAAANWRDCKRVVRIIWKALI